MIKRNMALREKVLHVTGPTQFPICLFRGRYVLTLDSGYKAKLACIWKGYLIVPITNVGLTPLEKLSSFLPASLPTSWWGHSLHQLSDLTLFSSDFQCELGLIVCCPFWIADPTWWLPIELVRLCCPLLVSSHNKSLLNEFWNCILVICFSNC